MGGFGSGSFQETIKVHTAAATERASLIHALQGWRRQEDQPIRRVMPQPEA